MALGGGSETYRFVNTTATVELRSDHLTGEMRNEELGFEPDGDKRLALALAICACHYPDETLMPHFSFLLWLFRQAAVPR